MIVGFDEDRSDIFDSMLAFLIKQTLVRIRLRIDAAARREALPAFGGGRSAALQVLVKLHVYDSAFHPRHLTAEEVEKGLWHIYDEFYSLRSICSRLLFPAKRWLTVR